MSPFSPAHGPTLSTLPARTRYIRPSGQYGSNTHTARLKLLQFVHNRSFRHFGINLSLAVWVWRGYLQSLTFWQLPGTSWTPPDDPGYGIRGGVQASVMIRVINRAFSSRRSRIHYTLLCLSDGNNGYLQESVK